MRIRMRMGRRMRMGMRIRMGMMWEQQYRNSMRKLCKETGGDFHRGLVLSYVM